MTDKLKSCPFCGGKAIVINIEEGENQGGSCVCCEVCQASSNVEFGFKENFVDNWNKRSPVATSAVAAAYDPTVQPYDEPFRHVDAKLAPGPASDLSQFEQFPGDHMALIKAMTQVCTIDQMAKISTMVIDARGPDGRRDPTTVLLKNRRTVPIKAHDDSVRGEYALGDKIANDLKDVFWDTPKVKEISDYVRELLAADWRRRERGIAPDAPMEQTVLKSSEVKEAILDIRTHRNAWLHAMNLARDTAAKATFDTDDVSYWEHEIKVHDRICDALLDFDARRDEAVQAVNEYMIKAGEQGIRAERAETRAAELTKALQPLVDIADAYKKNDLDDEARRCWGPDLEHENDRDPAEIELYAGRGGKRLLTLADCLKASDIVRGFS